MRARRSTTVDDKQGPSRSYRDNSRQDQRWMAVLARDREADDKFVYAVRSTGVYCRPSCPSRRPNREKVLFFASPKTAEQHGFRPCRRCKPRATGSTDPRVALAKRICRQIDSQVEGSAADTEAKSLRLSALASSEGLSSHQLERAFRAVMGITPRQYAEAQRMNRLKSQLRKGNDVTDAIYGAGFSSSSRLYDRSNANLGMTPATYRRGGSGMNINYAIADSPLGRVLVGATDRGISAVYMGDSDAKLESALRREYPRANIRKDKNGLERSMKQIVAYLHGSQPNLDLPTDVQATAFQNRVWRELRRIPRGTTRSYSEVARSIGKPRAIRAVARACATNPTCLVVPCHRVVRKNGGLAGYRWGMERKKILLDRESKQRKTGD